jgi:hypothetical protein
MGKLKKDRFLAGRRSGSLLMRFSTSMRLPVGGPAGEAAAANRAVRHQAAVLLAHLPRERGRAARAAVPHAGHGAAEAGGERGRVLVAR